MPDRSELFPQRDNAGTPCLTGEPLAQGDDDRFGKGLAGTRGQLSCQLVGFGMFDAERHNVDSRLTGTFYTTSNEFASSVAAANGCVSPATTAEARESSLLRWGSSRNRSVIS